MVEIIPSGPIRLTAYLQAAETDYLWITPDLAGAWWPLAEDHLSISLRFLPTESGEISANAAYPDRWVEDGQLTQLGAALLEARIDIGPTVSQFETSDHIRLGLWRARRVAGHLLAWCKIEQPWLGRYEALPALVGDAHAVALDTGKRWIIPADAPHQRLEGLAVRGFGEPPIDRGRLGRFVVETKNGVLPDAAASMLADAYFAAFCSVPRDLTRAILLAAFSSEISTRAALMKHVLPDQKQQYEKWFPVQGPASKPVREWAGPVAEALVGRSLEQEDGGLFRQVAEMVRVRNDLAHRGVMPTLDQTLDAVRTAKRLGAWLSTWGR
jgi:hypothetical protein